MARRFSMAFVMLAGMLISSPWAVAQEQKAKQPERIAISDLKEKLDSG